MSKETMEDRLKERFNKVYCYEECTIIPSSGYVNYTEEVKEFISNEIKREREEVIKDLDHAMNNLIRLDLQTSGLQELSRLIKKYKKT